jgi:hypothetical protein
MERKRHPSVRVMKGPIQMASRSKIDEGAGLWADNLA